LEKEEFNHEEEIMSCVYGSFYMGCEPKYDTFVFNDQCDDLMHASISSFPSASHESLPCAPISLSLELKPLFNTLKSAFWGSNGSIL